jgi:peptidoglycan glycosyltransferase
MNRELKRISLVIIAMFVALFASSSVIQVVQADALAQDERNTRTLYDSYRSQRGSILVGGNPVAESIPADDQYRYQRVYPAPLIYSNVTGYFTLNQGLTGIEGAMNTYLSGKDESQFLAQLNSILTGKEPQGASVELTLNPALQQKAWDALGNYTGSVVVSEPATGRILAMVSKPSFDPNSLASHNTDSVIAAYKALISDPGDPLIDRSIAGAMNPPGSIFKLVMVAAALESGKYTAESTFPNPASLTLPGTSTKIYNWNRSSCPGAGAEVSLTTALQYSCNIPFAELGLALGREAILTQAKKFGFNTSFQIPMTTAVSTFPTVMDDAQTALASFGQFDVRATPLQMAMVSAAIGNGGKVLYPSVVHDVLQPNLTVIAPFEVKEFSQAMSPENAAALNQMMVNSVDHGLASSARITGVRVAGKTGTAENGAGEPYTLWFTGFAPAESPKYAITVLVENGGGLGQEGNSNLIAAAIAKQVLEAELTK